MWYNLNFKMLDNTIIIITLNLYIFLHVAIQKVATYLKS